MKANSQKKNLEQAIIKLIKEENSQTVEQLVNAIKEELKIPEQEILETVLELQAEGKITFRRQMQKPPQNFIAYLKAGQARWYWLTTAATIATAIIALTISDDFYPWIYLRYVLGLIFVLWLPGYTFIRALFSNGAQEKGLDTIERIALSIGMSLALVPIVGLLLNYTPWGIRLVPMVISLLGLTLVFATVALLREYLILKVK